MPVGISLSAVCSNVSLFFLCQVSHHPPISAFYICNRKDGFSISGSILAKSKFYGTAMCNLFYKAGHVCLDKSSPLLWDTTRCCQFKLFNDLHRKVIPVFLTVVLLCPAAVGNSLSAILDGKARLLFLSRDEEYVITMPYAHCKGKRSTVNIDHDY